MATFRAQILLAALLAPACLAGCSGTAALPPVNHPQPVAVERFDRREALYFATGSSEPDAASRQRLVGLLAGIPAGTPVRARIVAHADVRGGDAANLALSQRRAERVAALVRAQRPEGAEISIVARGELEPLGDLPRDRRVDLVLSHGSVVPPACGQFSQTVGVGDPFNEPLADLGCSTRSNLASMVADPLDLVSGRELAPADATREAEAIVRYRTDKVKTPVSEATN